MTQLSDDNRGLARDLLGKLGANRTAALDVGDPLDRSVIQRFLALGGVTPDRYPGLHAALNGQAGGAGAGPEHAPQVVDLGKDRAGGATSRTWVGVSDLPLFAGAVTLVVDADTHAPLAAGHKATVGESLVQVATQAAAAAAPRQTAMTVSYAVGQSGAASFGATAQTAATVGDPLDPDITDPVVSVSGHTQVVIGLGRPAGSYNPDCDYTFSGSTNDNPPLLVPFAGTVTLPYNITGIGSDGQIAGLETSTQIYVALSESNISQPTNPAGLPSSCWSNTDTPRVFNWSYPYTPQEPISYAAAIGARDTTSAFFFQFTVPVDDPSSPFVFAICSTDTPGGESVQCTHIDDIKFTWHCIAAGTQVTLADGSSLPVESLTNERRVLTGAGGNLAVEANWRGEHSQPALKLTATPDAGGAAQTLTLTADHPVMTPSGPAAARDLNVGAKVLLTGGATGSITTVTETPASGQFWNLLLGDANDRANGAAVGPASFIANGIVVGDFNAQAAHHRALRGSYDYMLPRLPAQYHVDYASALADA